ncbi:HAD family hydrolase [Lysinibacillus macroides]|uniref:HAD family hydrolase n=1 Tax=Lysinibacillus macroides TaxID=33935 RepID=A0A0M9DMI0_9BACI|nr:HAD family hydrolase [Lysinibacillus macroides]KOY83456.1 HAD family hydrolase [Lysinibacillus macroides]QPR69328.1 HAD family hydrolase [Lysinibacillus macroides]
MLKAIIFDVDGTILDTEQAILQSLQRTLQQEQQGTYSFDELRFALGIPGKVALQRLQVREIEAVHQKWCAAMLDFSHEVAVFAELKPVIQTLVTKPLQLGIVTSKTRQEIVDEFDPFSLSHYFRQVISASDTKKHKPHPDPLLKCLDLLEVAPKDAIYIGDSKYDLQCAKQAGAKFALALWGAKTTNGFEGADFILQRPEEILQLIE